VSCAYAEKVALGERRLVQQTLGEALALSRDAATCLVYRDAVTGLEHLHRSRALADEGLRLALPAYTCRVFLDWREVVDDGARPWGALADRLAGRGVPSVDEAMLLLRLEPVHAALRAVLDPALVAAVASRSRTGPGAATPALAAAGDRVRAFLVEAREFSRRSADVTGGEVHGDIESAVHAFEDRLDAAPRIAGLEARFQSPWPPDARRLLAAGREALGAILAWAALEALGRVGDPSDAPGSAARMFDALRLRGVLADAVARLGLEGEDGWRAAARVRVALAHARSAPTAVAETAARPPTLDWLGDPDAAWLTGVNERDGVRSFVKEPFERLVWWMALPAVLTLAAEASPSPEAVRALEADIAARLQAAAAAGYRVP
jgi:hypothetical protein